MNINIHLTVVDREQADAAIKVLEEQIKKLIRFKYEYNPFEDPRFFDENGLIKFGDES